MEEYFKPEIHPILSIEPPIGIMPRWLWEEIRCRKLKKAIARYEEAQLDVDPAWVDELTEMIGKGRDGSEPEEHILEGQIKKFLLNTYFSEYVSEQDKELWYACNETAQGLVNVFAKYLISKK